MEFLECGHATNGKREECGVCMQRFNELEQIEDMGARVLIWIWVHGNRMDMDAWVLTWIWVHGSSYMDAFPTPRISHFLTPMDTLRWTVIL